MLFLIDRPSRLYKFFAFILLIAAMLPAHAGFAQAYNTVLGYSGLIVTPTADILADGQLSANIGRIPKLYADNYKPYDRTSYVVAMGFMPFMEATMGFIRPDNFQGGVGDRTVSVRFRLLNEQKRRIALAFGLQDFFAVKDLNLEPVSAQHFTSSYVVATKHFELSRPDMQLSLNMGYGFNWLPSDDRQLTGLFWGAQYSPMQQVQLLMEHDGKQFNAGVRFHFFRHAQYMLSFWQLKYLMHQLSFSIFL